MPFYKFNSVNDLHGIATRLEVPAVVDHIEYHNTALLGRLAGKLVTCRISHCSNYQPEVADNGVSYCNDWTEEWELQVNGQPAITFYQRNRGGLGF